ncbi:MAG: UDP-N-acetylglucosamine 2-epimerase (non-hydrolyzing), partial [Bacteroidia bacterium]|nr:UDP-N-acetylglucosamine 2-epimerase (non-hydrolyzing) [Bacteroidia bacterium]
ERPVTVAEGTNILVPFELDSIKGYIQQIENGTFKKGTIPKFWDGNSTNRILEFITKSL